MEIPEGYALKKQEALKDEFRFSLDGKELATFVTSYELKDNRLCIHNIEYYNLIQLDKKYFMEFKEIINAAADFNKAIVILTKK
jgi:hypothetical protein